MRETIPAALAGERIDRVVAVMAGCSRAAASALVGSGAVRVGGRMVTSRSARVAEGDVVDVEVGDRADPALRPEPELAAEIAVVHEDEDVAVIDKAAGVVVHPGAGNPTGTLVHGLLARYPELAGVGDPARPGIVHRLDRDTSGLLVVARTPDAHRALTGQLRERTMTRCYLALVWGAFDASHGVVDAPIARSARTPTRMAVSTAGRHARTRYDVAHAWADPEVTLVECTLETGRTHQIRVHLAAIGHPVVGDGRYGGARQSFPLGRFFLHAATLAFDHPVSGERLAFSSPLPADLQAALDRLG